MFQPLNQFELVYLGSFLFFPINNSIVYILIAFFFIFFFTQFINKRNFLISKDMFFIFMEFYFKFIVTLAKQQFSSKKGLRYIPFIFTLFTFILFLNLAGMTMYGFTVTSHIIVTFCLSMTVFIGVTSLGFYFHKINFLKIFLPSGAPGWLAPLLIFIELISYIARPFSLAIRLFANLMSGHTLLFILSNFTLSITEGFFSIIFIPFFLIVVIIGLELMIAMLQAYVFCVLSCIYINDSIVGGH